MKYALTLPLISTHNITPPITGRSPTMAGCTRWAGRDGSACLRSCESFDPHTNRWSPRAPMLQRRGGVGVGVVNGCLYALGGSDAPATSPNSSKFSCVER